MLRTQAGVGGAVNASQESPSTSNGMRVAFNKITRGSGALNANGHVNQNSIKLPAYTQSDEADNFSELLSRRAHHNLESQAHPTSRVYSSTPEWGNAVLTKEPMKSVNKALYERAVRSTPISSLRRNQSSPPWLTFATQQNSTQITALKSLIKDGLCKDANFKEFNLINIRPEDIEFDYITPKNGFPLPNVAVKNEPENPRLYGVFSVGTGTQKRQFKFLLSWDNLPARENGHHEEAFGRAHPENNGHAVANGVSQRDESQPLRSGGEDGPSRVPAELPGQNNGLPNNHLGGSRVLPLEDEYSEDEAVLDAAIAPVNEVLPHEDESSEPSLLGGSRTPIDMAGSQNGQTTFGSSLDRNSNYLPSGLFENYRWGSRTGGELSELPPLQTRSFSPSTPESQQNNLRTGSLVPGLSLTIQPVVNNQFQDNNQPQNSDSEEGSVSPPVSPQSQAALPPHSQSAQPIVAPERPKPEESSASRDPVVGSQSFLQRTNRFAGR